jgi:signal transduction histidine kinase
MATELGADGVIFLARGTGDPPFEPAEVEMVSAFGNHAALLLQLANARRGNEELRLVDDRRLIADDLRAGVIPELSRLSVDIQALASRAHDASEAAAVQSLVASADGILKELRTAIFALHSPPPAP